MDVNVAANAEESQINAVPDVDDDKHLDDSVGCDALERVCVKSRSETPKRSRRPKRQKVFSIVAEAVAFADELVQQVFESGIQGANKATPGTALVVETELESHTANLNVAQEEVANAGC